MPQYDFIFRSRDNSAEAPTDILLMGLESAGTLQRVARSESEFAIEVSVEAGSGEEAQKIVDHAFLEHVSANIREWFRPFPQDS